MNATRTEYEKGKARIFPTEPMIDNWLFTEDTIDQAELANAMAKVAKRNGLDANDMHHLFPAVLRMLCDKTAWTNL